MNETNLYLVVVLCQFQHFFDNGFIELAVLAVVLQGEALHPALLMQVQQHLRGNQITLTLDLVSKKEKSVLSNLLLQFVFPVIDSDGVIMPVQSMNQRLKHKSKIM